GARGPSHALCRYSCSALGGAEVRRHSISLAGAGDSLVPNASLTFHLRLSALSSRRGNRVALLRGPLGRSFEVHGFKPLRGFPEALEFVIPTGLFGEDVDDEVDVVQQHPLGLAVAFDVRRIETGPLQAELDFIGDRLDLPGIGSAANYKIVGESAGAFLQFEDRDFFGLLFLAGRNGFGALALGVGDLHESVVVRFPLSLAPDSTSGSEW